MAKVLGIGGVFFKARNPKQLADWYATWLGLEIDPSFGGAHFRPTSLPEKTYTVWAPFKETTDYFDPSMRPFMINLIVDDLSGALRQVKKGGCKPDGRPAGIGIRNVWLVYWPGGKQSRTLATEVA